MIEGNDGGATVSTNAGKSWTDQEFATAQMYHVDTDNSYPYNICGAQQDNSTYQINAFTDPANSIVRTGPGLRVQLRNRLSLVMSLDDPATGVQLIRRAMDTGRPHPGVP